MTYTQKVEEHFKDSGLVEVPSRSRKYRKFKSKSGKIYWLGKSGAVRVGETIGKSISISRRIKAIIKTQEAFLRHTTEFYGG